MNLANGWSLKNHDRELEHGTLQIYFGPRGSSREVVGMSAFLFILTSAKEAGGLMGHSPEPLKLKP